MKSAIIEEYNQPLVVKNSDDPICADDAVIVKVESCGVCRSDWHGWCGEHPKVKPPHIPGHECAGIVVEVGRNVKRFQKDDAVVAPFILGCGICHDCLHHSTTICNNQYVLGFGSNGAFAEYVSLPHADYNIQFLPEFIDFNIAAAMGCRFTTAYSALKKTRQAKSKHLVVLGAGGVGLSLVMIAKALGYVIHAVDISDDALKKAKICGADYIYHNHDSNEATQMIIENTKGGADISVDALGITATFQQSLQLLRKRGQHIQLGLPTGAHKDVNLPLFEQLYAKQLHIMGSRGADGVDFHELFTLIAQQKINPAILIEKEIALHEITDVFRDMSANKNSGINILKPNH